MKMGAVQVEDRRRIEWRMVECCGLWFMLMCRRREERRERKEELIVRANYLQFLDHLA
jgi:hypothetical protein